MKDWKEIYPLPLTFDGYTYAWAKDGQMALMFDDGFDSKDAERIVAVINGNSKHKLTDISLKDGEFFIQGEYAFCVRGWGYLTGRLRLSDDVASAIQDEFAEYILKQLKR